LNRVNQWVLGELHTAGDNTIENETMLDKAGMQAAILLGALSYQSSYHAIQTSTDNTNAFIGGSNQICVLGGRICDEITQASFAIPANSSGSTRIDLIIGLATEVPVNGFTRDVRQPDRSIVPTTCYQYAQNVTFQYVQGTGNFLPAIPGGYAAAGYVGVAQVVVPNLGPSGAHPPVPSIILPTLSSIMSSLITAGVQTIGGLSGIVGLLDGPGIAIVQVGNSWEWNNTGVLLLNGLGGTIGLNSPLADIGIANVGGNIQLTNLGTRSLNALKGDLTLAALHGGTFTPSGSTITYDPGFPIGGTIPVMVRLSVFAGDNILTFASALPGDSSYQYSLYARASYVPPTSNSGLAGSGLRIIGSGATWDNAGNYEVRNNNGTCLTIDMLGSATGGQTPSINVHVYQGTASLNTAYNGVLVMTAIRTA
jgi:hypothetical protein